MSGFPEEYKEGKIYKAEDGSCVISFRGQWIVGIYANDEAAKSAIELCGSGREDWLDRLWNGIQAPKQNITIDLLRFSERMELGL